MKRFGAVLLLACLAACGGGRPASVLPQTVPLGSLESLRSATEAQSDAIRQPQPLYTPGTNDLLYVSNQGNNSITVYKHNANGNTAPLKVLAGSKTGINIPGQLSEDASGNLYVANLSSILVFAHGASGNVAPIRQLYGPNTGIQYVEGVIVDQTTGKIFVANLYNDPDLFSHLTIRRFPPNATGNEAPFAVYDFGCDMFQLAQDSSGNNLLVTHGACGSDGFSGVDWVPKQFPTATAPPYGISFFATEGIADDPTTKSYLVTHGNGDTVLPGIVGFKEDTTGFGPDNPDYPNYEFSPALVSDITSAVGCGELAVGYLRNIYAVCGSAINVYSHDSSGNVAPLRVIKGSATKLNEPYGIYEGQ